MGIKRQWHKFMFYLHAGVKQSPSNSASPCAGDQRQYMQANKDIGQKELTRHDVHWWLDLFIFDNIFRYVLKKEADNITAWRLHRRWTTDATGHACSLYCLCDKETALYIQKSIARSKFFKMLQSSWYFRAFEHKIEDFSDEWPKALRKSWPLFAQGLSEFFLEYMRDSKVVGGRKACKSLLDYQPHYETMLKDMNKDWYWFGRHAFFHHINGMFAYEHLQISFVELGGIVGSV